jgi:hypothetical protein
VTNHARITDDSIAGITAEPIPAPSSREANASAVKGAVQLWFDDGGVNLAEVLYTTSGTVTDGFIGSGVSQTITVAADAGQPAFQVTDAECLPTASSDLKAGKMNLAASGVNVAESVTLTAVDATSATGVFLVSKPATTVATQAVCAGMFPSFVTVGDAIKVSVDGGTATWKPGTFRNDGPDVVAQLGFFNKLLLNGATVTFTIATPGITFSPNTCLFVDAATPRAPAGRSCRPTAADVHAQPTPWPD